MFMSLQLRRFQRVVLTPEWVPAFDLARMGSRKAARNMSALQAQSSQSVAMKAAGLKRSNSASMSTITTMAVGKPCLLAVRGNQQHDRP